MRDKPLRLLEIIVSFLELDESHLLRGGSGNRRVGVFGKDNGKKDDCIVWWGERAEPKTPRRETEQDGPCRIQGKRTSTMHQAGKLLERDSRNS